MVSARALLLPGKQSVPLNMELCSEEGLLAKNLTNLEATMNTTPLSPAFENATKMYIAKKENKS